MNSIRKLKIFFFSGTGNAKQIAKWFAESAIKKGIDCRLFNIAKTDIKSIPLLDPEDLIFIISPVHGFNFPKITLDFIASFPDGKNNIVLMNTRAGMKIGHWVTPGLTGVGFFLSSFILKRKGYKIKGKIPFDMPSNWISIHPALNEKTTNFIYKTNYYRVKKHAAKLLAGETDCPAHRDLIQDTLISPVSLTYYVVGRFFLAKSFYASGACNHCGLCEKMCPVKAINNSKKQPFWTFRCESCMKCMNICPKQAIETTHGLWIILFILGSSISGLISSFLPFLAQSALFQITILSIILIILLSILYRIQHLLLKNKYFSKLIAFTSLTHYRFWGRYMCSIKESNK